MYGKSVRLNCLHGFLCQRCVLSFFVFDSIYTLNENCWALDLSAFRFLTGKFGWCHQHQAWVDILMHSSFAQLAHVCTHLLSFRTWIIDDIMFVSWMKKHHQFSRATDLFDHKRCTSHDYELINLFQNWIENAQTSQWILFYYALSMELLHILCDNQSSNCQK